MAKIEKVAATEILDTRGNPTVHVEVVTQGGFRGEAQVPSGASTGVHEAVELRDGDERRYEGQGVLKAVENVNREIFAALTGKDTANQTKIDRLMLELDGTDNKGRLGANAILAVSLACARAEAAAQGLPLYLYLQQLFPKRQASMPVPQMNLINGGKHASNNLSIQEYHVLPVGSPTFAEALRMGSEIHHALRDLLKAEGYPVEIGDEGGYAPRLKTSEEAFTFLVRAIEKAGYTPGVDAFLGIDAAASEFHDADNNQYLVDGTNYSPADLGHLYRSWRQRYPLISLEDPFDEDAWDDWVKLMGQESKMMQIVGDDLYATNATRIRQGIVQGATNAVLIKLNQVGTLSETLQAILLTQEAKMNVVVSHRSGETEDTFIADLAVATGAGQIKTGAPRADRVAKYNRLLQIEHEVGPSLGKTLSPFLEHATPHYRQTAAVPAAAGVPAAQAVV